MPFSASIYKKIFVPFVVIILIIIATLIFIKYYSPRKEIQTTTILTSTLQLPTISVSTTTEPISNITGMKTYRNEEWGFEFQYPQNLILKEDTFKSYYSKFNLELFAPLGKKRDLTFDVNIVLPEFPDRSFKNIEKIISEIIVAGVPGVKYEYQFEGFPETAVILPFGEYKMILGTGGGTKQYLNEFNQILSTFKFLK